jgi:hypothetical protein
VTVAFAPAARFRPSDGAISALVATYDVVDKFRPGTSR